MYVIHVFPRHSIMKPILVISNMSPIWSRVYIYVYASATLLRHTEQVSGTCLLVDMTCHE